VFKISCGVVHLRAHQPAQPVKFLRSILRAHVDHPLVTPSTMPMETIEFMRPFFWSRCQHMTEMLFYTPCKAATFPFHPSELSRPRSSLMLAAHTRAAVLYVVAPSFVFWVLQVQVVYALPLSFCPPFRKAVQRHASGGWSGQGEKAPSPKRKPRTQRIYHGNLTCSRHVWMTFSLMTKISQTKKF
jgi:hypothetical protein